jgi:hypothetical protein
MVIAIGASCGLVTDSCACSQPAGPFVGVAGTVTDESGATLEGVHVTLSVRDVTCQEPLAGPFAVATDTAGHYAVGAEVADEGTEACGEIEALRALTASVDTVLATIDLTFGFEPPDTLDLVFPTR